MGELGDKLEKLIESKARERLASGGGSGARWGSGEPRRLSNGQLVALGSPQGTSKGMAAPGVIHSRGESGYSLLRLVEALARRDPSRAPYEFALSEKLENAGYAPTHGGVMVPWGGGDTFYHIPGREEAIEGLATEVKQAMPFVTGDEEEMAWLSRKMGGTKAMDPLDDSLGGSTIVFPSQGPPIQLLRPNPVIQQAGAQIVPLPVQGSLYYPRETGDPTFTWLGPNTPIPDSASTTGALTLSAKRAGALIKMPIDLVRYSGGAAEALVRTGLLRRGELTEDLAALEGTGGTLQPLGILRHPLSAADTPTTDKVTLHVAGTAATDGDTFTASDVLRMMSLVEEAPDPEGPNAWIMRPLMFSGLANLRADQGGGAGTGAFMFPVTRGDLGGVVRKELAGLPVFASTQVSKARRKGSGTALSYVLTGNFRRAVLGRVGAIELVMSLEAGFEASQLWLRAELRGDFGLTWAQAFCLCDTLVIPT